MNAQRFAQGDTYEQFLAKLPPAEKSGYRLSQRRAEAALAGSSPAGPESPLSVACVGESWCLDTRVNLPLLALLFQRLSLSLRIFTRDQAPDLNVVRIPTFIFFNPSFQEVGRWVERPATVAHRLREGSEEEKKTVLSEYVAGKHHPETLAEISNLIGEAVR